MAEEAAAVNGADYYLVLWFTMLLASTATASYEPTGDSSGPTAIDSEASGSEQLIYNSPTRTFDSFTHGITQTRGSICRDNRSNKDEDYFNGNCAYEPIRNSTGSKKTGDGYMTAASGATSAVNGADRGGLNALAPLLVVGFVVAVMIL